MELFSHDHGIVLTCVSVDLQINPVTGDLSKAEVVDFWKARIRQGQVVGLMAGPPCGTWSVARFNRRRPGPRPVRSVEHLWGLPDLESWERKAVDLGNLLLRVSFEFISALLVCKGFFCLEHPADPGISFPSIWKLSEVGELMLDPSVSLTTLHQ